MPISVDLDVCCLNRPFDDQSQDRIRLEAEAVLLILEHCESDEWIWIGSEAMGLEVGQTPDPERQLRVEMLMHSIDRSLQLEEPDVRRAEEIEALGFHALDALHVAFAERGTADVFLTTEDRLLRRAKRESARLRVRVEDPLTWLQEIARP